MLPVNYLDLVRGCFAGTTPADLQGLSQSLAGAERGKNVVVHFHGGLVGRGTALATADQILFPAYQAAAYPVFFLWNSDVLTTITMNLDAIVQERSFQRLVYRL